MQLVANPVNSTVCNWPEIVSKTFTEGAGNYDYSLRRIFQIGSPFLRIGGSWPSMGTQIKRSIDDKVLMVFKFKLSSTVDNGDGDRSERDGTAGGDQESTTPASFFYERYGEQWQTYDTAGYNGTADVISADSAAFVLYKINVGEDGRYDVKVHFPTSQYGTATARYEVFVCDYQEEPIGDTDLGSPVLSTTIDQSDSTSYAAFADEEGFRSIGVIDVNVDGDYGLSTVVIKLSVPEEDRSTSEASSALLISDAAGLELVE